MGCLHCRAPSTLGRPALPRPYRQSQSRGLTIWPPWWWQGIDQATIERWAASEGKTRASSARLAWRLLTVFLTWCGEQSEYAALLPAKNPAKTKKAREALGKAGTKSDVLQREQLPDRAQQPTHAGM